MKLFRYNAATAHPHLISLYRQHPELSGAINPQLITLAPIIPPYIMHFQYT